MRDGELVVRAAGWSARPEVRPIAADTIVGGGAMEASQHDVPASQTVFVSFFFQ